MIEAVTILEGRCKKLTAKVERLRSQLDMAETELSENQTALRVLSNLVPDSAADNMGDSRDNNHAKVLSVLPKDEADALTPKDVHQKLVTTGVTISPDNVRTILVRLRQGEKVAVEGGRYWRIDEPQRQDIRSHGFQRTATAMSGSDFDDLDAEVPF